MLAKLLSGGLNGLDGYIVEVEVDISQGLPGFDIVGLPDNAVKEAKERVTTAIKNSGYNFPVKKIIVNLAPANTKKVGATYDLPIALGILCCMQAVKAESLTDIMFLGELSLDGTVKPIEGVLPLVISAKEMGIRKFVVPFDNQVEASLVSDVEIVGVKSIYSVIRHLNGAEVIEPVVSNTEELFKRAKQPFEVDFSDVKGQEGVKRALEIAAAGMHNVVIIGPPGAGKTMMAKRVPTILPELSFDESLEITKIYSVAGLLKSNDALITQRPFRSPHHTISNAAMVGGGKYPKPGEVSLSHNGVLFLDEFPEFKRSVLEELRQPLEDREITISRVNGTMTYPANLMLVASMNPCPCGYSGYSDKCKCTTNEINRYMGKISGPLLDRIDLQVEASAVEYSDLDVSVSAESSDEIKKRVVKAHEIQLKRYADEGIYFNSQLGAAQIEKYCVLGEKERAILKLAFEKLELSARAYHKLLKIARTIADLAGSENIETNHIAEAISLRNLDRKFVF